LISVIVARREAAGLKQRQLGERQLNVLEFMEISRALGVRASTLMEEIEGQ